MSGHATWNLALHYPTYFAAINPMSGGTGTAWQKVRVVGLRNIFSVVWHDADDTILKVDISREMVKLLRQYKYDVDYEETKGIGHAPTDAIAEERYQKMRSRSARALSQGGRPRLKSPRHPLQSQRLGAGLSDAQSRR